MKKLYIPTNYYAILIMLLSSIPSGGGGEGMTLGSFFGSVLASIVAYYVCKWFDRYLH